VAESIVPAARRLDVLRKLRRELFVLSLMIMTFLIPPEWAAVKTFVKTNNVEKQPNVPVRQSQPTETIAGRQMSGNLTGWPC